MGMNNKASFINSVAGGQIVPCPKCGNANKPGSTFCASCGSEIVAAKMKEGAAFAPIAENLQQDSKAEPEVVFAKGLPAWDIVPPQVMVRRH